MDNDFFGNNDLFADDGGDFGSGGFGNSGDGFGSESNGFGSGNGFGDSSESDDFSFDAFDSTNNSAGSMDSISNNSDEFTFESQDNQFTDDENDNGMLKKQSYIFIIIGVVALILVIIIASLVGKKIHNKNKQKEPIEEPVRVEETQPVKNNDVDANKVMQSGRTEPKDNNKVVVNTKDNNFTWSEITDSENVVFTDEMVEMQFTITDIQHLARVVDTNGNLVVKTKLLGSISGLSGTYELDIPYDKGIKLVVGKSFTIRVQLGTFSDKTVVGNIEY